MTTSQILLDAPGPARSLVTSEATVTSDEDLAWLNHTVAPLVRQALDATMPLADRLRLQAAACDRLDQFFALPLAKRSSAAGLGSRPTDRDVQAAAHWSSLAAKRAHALTVALHDNWQGQLQAQLAHTHGMRLARACQLGPEQQRELRHQVARRIWPLLTPLAVDQGHPFPRLRDRELNLAVLLCEDCHGRVRRHATFVIVAVPSVFGRTLSVRPRAGGPETLVLVEDAIAANVGLVFPESHFSACCPFRITRRRLRETSSVRPGPRPSHPGPIRLEIAGATPEVESLLQSHLGLEDWDICRVSGTLRLGDLSTLGYRALQ
jgi:polyphosphate kinase